jgi:hypothetical protein
MVVLEDFNLSEPTPSLKRIAPILSNIHAVKPGSSILIEWIRRRDHEAFQIMDF